MRSDTFLRSSASCVASLLLVALTGSGCGSNESNDPAARALAEEKVRLEGENQDLAQVRLENEEVQRLRKENQELPKTRSQYQEVARLKKDNDQLRQQIAKISPAAGATNAALAAAAINAADLAQLAQQDQGQPQVLADEPNAIHEEDDILIEPKFLKQLLPDIDWDKMERKEAVAVRSLLEKDGVQITNISQLIEAGITNFVVRRSVRPVPGDAQPPAVQPAGPQ